MFVAVYCSSVAYCVEEIFELVLQQFKLSVNAPETKQTETKLKVDQKAYFPMCQDAETYLPAWLHLMCAFGLQQIKCFYIFVVQKFIFISNANVL